MKSPVYLDHAAAAPPDPEILDYFRECSLLYYANQEGIHAESRRVRAALDEAAAELIELLCDGDGDCVRVLWADSATSAIAAAFAHPRFRSGRIVASRAEHPAMSRAVSACGALTAELRLRRGFVDIEELEKTLNANTGLVTLHHIQSETGAIQDLAAVRACIDRVSPRAMFMSDTVQSAGKLSSPWKTARLDFMFVSGHKLGAPGGAAMLYRDSAMRAGYDALRKEYYLLGRPNPPQAMALVRALGRKCGNMAENHEKMSVLSTFLRESLAEKLGNRIRFTIDTSRASAHIIHVLLPDYEGAVITRMLSEAGFCVSPGSACSAETRKPSEALLASGLDRKLAFSGLRISPGPENTIEELSAFVEELSRILKDY